MKRAAAAALLLLSGCALFDHPAQPAPGPGASTGEVIIYRDRHPGTEDIVLTVREDETVIGTLRNGTYLRRHATAGRHYYSISPPGSDSDEEKPGEFVRVQPGGRYFLQAIPRFAPRRVKVRVYLMFAVDAAPVIETLKEVGAGG